MTYLIISLLILVMITYYVLNNPDRIYSSVILPVSTMLGKNAFVSLIMTFRKPTVDKFVMKWELAELVGNCTGKEYREIQMSDLDKLFFSELQYTEFFNQNDISDLALDNDIELSKRIDEYFVFITKIEKIAGINPSDSVTNIIKSKYGNIIDSIADKI